MMKFVVIATGTNATARYVLTCIPAGNCINTGIVGTYAKILIYTHMIYRHHAIRVCCELFPK